MPGHPLRVLLVSGSLTPMKCGVGDYAAHLAAALSRLPSIEVTVLTSVEARQQPPDLPFDVLPIVEEWSMREASRILAAIRRWNPDVVHMQFPTRGYGPRYLPWILPATLALLRVPVVQTWHEYYPAGSGWRNILNALAPGGLVVVRPNYVEQMPGWYRHVTSSKLIRLIPNAAALPTIVLSVEERQAVRERLGADRPTLVAYFGFVYPEKGVDTLFDIADPDEDHLVLVADLSRHDVCHAAVLARIHAAPWHGRPRVTGFLPARDAAATLAAADAVVLPFVGGSGVWNSSLHAASNQGVFVLTTSRERRGYDAEGNVYYAAPGDLDEMRSALRQYRGRRGPHRPDNREDQWRTIAQAHRELYGLVAGIEIRP